MERKCITCKHAEDESAFCVQEDAPECVAPTFYLWEPEEEDEEIPFRIIAIQIADLVEEKQRAYGDSFGKAKDFLKILYPNGIPVERYKDMLTLVRIWDKIMRIATDKDALGESPYSDIMGYCLLALNEEENL